MNRDAPCISVGVQETGLIEFKYFTLKKILRSWMSLDEFTLTELFFKTGRVICTCYAGFRFIQELHRQSANTSSSSNSIGSFSKPTNIANQSESIGIIKACEDIDECSTGDEDCQQVIYSLTLFPYTITFSSKEYIW